MRMVIYIAGIRGVLYVLNDADNEMRVFEKTIEDIRANER
jgi:hypothetical protein